MKYIPSDLKAVAGDSTGGGIWTLHLRLEKKPLFWKIEVINKEYHLHKSTSFATNHGGFFF